MFEYIPLLIAILVSIVSLFDDFFKNGKFIWRTLKGWVLVALALMAFIWSSWNLHSTQQENANVTSIAYRQVLDGVGFILQHVVTNPIREKETNTLMFEALRGKEHLEVVARIRLVARHEQSSFVTDGRSLIGGGFDQPYQLFDYNINRGEKLLNDVVTKHSHYLSASVIAAIDKILMDEFFVKTLNFKDKERLISYGKEEEDRFNEEWDYIKERSYYCTKESKYCVLGYYYFGGIEKDSDYSSFLTFLNKVEDLVREIEKCNKKPISVFKPSTEAYKKRLSTFHSHPDTEYRAEKIVENKMPSNATNFDTVLENATSVNFSDAAILPGFRVLNDSFPVICLKGFSDYIYSFCLDKENRIFYYQNSRPSSGGTFIRLNLKTGVLIDEFRGGETGPADQKVTIDPIDNGQYPIKLLMLSEATLSWANGGHRNDFSLEEREKLRKISILLNNLHANYPSIKHNKSSQSSVTKLKFDSVKIDISVSVVNCDKVDFICKSFTSKEASKFNGLRDYNGFEKYMYWGGFFATFDSPNGKTESIEMTKYNNTTYRLSFKCDISRSGFFFYLFKASKAGLSTTCCEDNYFAYELDLNAK